MEWDTECTTFLAVGSGALRLRLHAPYEILSIDLGLL
jgi:hypothetical protein